MPETLLEKLLKKCKVEVAGQPFYATAGGNNVAGLDAAIAKALSFLN
jgi:hypothetical protein